MTYQGLSDFRSDTVTRPTESMRQAMARAEVGDDVHGDDPTVNRLEELAAELLGKQASLFVPSGTMGNTIAMKLAAGEGKGVILEEKCHIVNFEAGNISRIAQSLPRLLPSNRGQMPLDLIRENIFTTLTDHIPETKVIALENTHNTWGGAILSQEYIKDVKSIAQEARLHMHLDGARMFNAAVAQNITVKEISSNFDSIMFCLSKGLSAPIGSILAGDKSFIDEARVVRKFLGGGMRQVGVIAAPAIVALETMVDRLADDHARAKRLAEMVTDIPGLMINPDKIDTNFMMLKLSNLDATEFLKRLAQHRVLALPFTSSLVRFVTHKDINDEDVDRAALAIREVMSQA